MWATFKTNGPPITINLSEVIGYRKMDGSSDTCVFLCSGKEMHLRISYEEFNEFFLRCRLGPGWKKHYQRYLYHKDIVQGDAE